jgi:hypothetical protein
MFQIFINQLLQLLIKTKLKPNQQLPKVLLNRYILPSYKTGLENGSKYQKPRLSSRSSTAKFRSETLDQRAEQEIL